MSSTSRCRRSRASSCPAAPRRLHGCTSRAPWPAGPSSPRSRRRRSTRSTRWRASTSTGSRTCCSSARAPRTRSRAWTSPSGGPAALHRIPGMATTEEPEAGLGGLDEWRRELYEARPRRGGVAFSTMSGLENEPLYTPENVELDYERDLGFPGVYPFTRGVYPSMYRGRLWTMRQFAGFGTAEETNERFRYLRAHGQTGFSTAFDMPTLMGYDSDHPRSLGEVGREGVAVDSLDDMETLFAGIPLGEVSTSMTINGPAAMLLAFYACVGEEQGVPVSALRGTVQTDILKEYIAQKEWIFPPEPSMR